MGAVPSPSVCGPLPRADQGRGPGPLPAPPAGAPRQFFTGGLGASRQAFEDPNEYIDKFSVFFINFNIQSLFGIFFLQIYQLPNKICLGISIMKHMIVVVNDNNVSVLITTLFDFYFCCLSL